MISATPLGGSDSNLLRDSTLAGIGAAHRERGGNHRGRDRRGNDTHPAGSGRGDVEAGSTSREDNLVIVPASGVKVLIAMKPVDFRKGMDGLAAVVRESLGADPYGGVIHVFRPSAQIA
jgi:IS66 Orf2 like protein